PADQVLQILWRNRVQRLGSRGQADLRNIQQQLTADMQAFLNLEGIIQVRIINETFPAHGSTGLFKIDTHDDINGVADFFSELVQTLSIIFCRLDIVDRAGANHQKNTVILAIQDIANGSTALGYNSTGFVGKRQLLLELSRRNQ